MSTDATRNIDPEWVGRIKLPEALKADAVTAEWKALWEELDRAGGEAWMLHWKSRIRRQIARALTEYREFYEGTIP